MKTKLPWILLALALVGFTYQKATATFFHPTYQAYGLPIGVLNISTTSVDAGVASTPFQVQGDTSYLVECNAAACFGAGPFASCTSADPNQYPLWQASTVVQVYVPANQSSIAAMANSGTGACTIWPVLR